MKTISPVFFFTIASMACAQIISASNGSLWSQNNAEVSQSLFADRVANRVGDLITIVVNLQTAATKNQQTDTAKKTSVNDVLTALLYPQSDGPYDWYRYRNPSVPGASFPPTMTWSADQKFSGGGKINNSETLTTTIEARIVDIAPNGVMQLEARRHYEAGEEKNDIVLAGFVRREDIANNNTVQSTQISELQIRQEGTGTLSRNQNKGWLTRLYEMINPF